MRLDLNLAEKLKEEFNSRNSKYKTMYNYFIGHTDTLLKYPQTDRSNRIATTNYIRKFVLEETSFAVGNPITYVSRNNNKELINDINFNLSFQKGSLDSETMQNMLTFGESYELYYLYNGEFKIKNINPLQGIAYCNTEGQAELFLYFYKRELDDTTYIDIFDDGFIYHYDEDFEEIARPTPHYFGRCPVGVSKLPEGVYSTIFNEIKTLQDNYELTLSDYSNEISDTRMAYLALYGVQLDTDTAADVKDKGILQIPDSNGKAEWLIKNIPSDFIKNFLDTVEGKIYEISQHINHNIMPASNTSGVALQTRLISLRNKITINQQCLTDCIKARLRCLVHYLNIAEGKNYNYRDIIVKYTLNVPSNDLEMAQIIAQLGSKLSASTGLNQLSFITDGAGEFEKALEENKRVMDDVNLDNIEGGIVE